MEKVCGLFQKPFLSFQRILLINTKTKKLKKEKQKKLASTASPSQTLDPTPKTLNPEPYTLNPIFYLLKGDNRIWAMETSKSN